MAAVVLCGLAFTSCGDDDDDKVVNPMDGYISALEKLYPKVPANTEWEREYGYIVAEFTNSDGFDTEVWFDADQPVWAMTKVSYDVVKHLPDAVRADFESGRYADWTVDDVDYYTRPAAEFYVIEVEKVGEKSMDLFYYADGTLIKAQPDSETKILPTTPL